jgi:hypothetical protein
MPTPPADTNLSLGKLGRATAVGNSNHTTITSLNDCARDSGTAQTKLQDFYISAVVNDLTGYAYVDEQTNETYELTFTNANTLFGTRIKTRAANFTWTTADSDLFDMSGTEDYTTQYNAGAIADATSATTFESTLVTDGEFSNWSGANLDDWTESGTISKNTSGATGSAVQFESDGAYVEQSFTAKGNSTYQLSSLGKSSNHNGSFDISVSSSAGIQTFTNTGTGTDWAQFREDFYTSGSVGVNQTVKLKFEANIASGVYPSLDTVSFQRWEGAHMSDTNVAITGKYWDAGQTDGFNDHATRYNTAISKTVEIQDTYAGLAIACFLPGTKIKMSDGSMKNIEDISVDDEVLSVIIPDLPDEDLGYNEWKTFTSTGDMTSLEASSATVEKIFYDYMDGYWNVNDGLIKVTEEHDLWTYTFIDNAGDARYWKWRKPSQLQIGQSLLDHEGNLIEVTSIEKIEEEVEVVNIDVEPLDVYFAGGILVHNKGASSDPGS